MKKFVIGLLICFCAGAQVSDVEVVQNLQNEIVSEKSKNAEELQKVLERYFNDGCKVVVNDEEVVLKKERFPQYAKIGAAFVSKIKKDHEKDYKFEIPKNILNDNGRNNEKSDGIKQSVFLNISEKQRVKIDFVLENKKFSEVSLKDVPLSRGQKLMLRGVFNLLK